MRIGTGVLSGLALGIALTTGACDGGPDQTGETSEAIEREGDTDLSADIDRPVGRVEAYEGARSALESRNQSGVTGSVTARRLDGTVRIELELENVDTTARYVPYLYRGTCDEPAERVTTLELFDHTPEGTTHSESTMEVEELDPETRYFIRVDGGGRPRIACGPLPEIPRSGDTEARPTTGNENPPS
ncbi:MAG: hypothetical protein R3326_06285 [Gemmatimonadota bacterium]|nr:hypothetical protein [Gemmatimonadota bacterium]